ncbi:hypothetical protein ABVT39_012094 [Epinephelus coioides]
MAVRRFTAEMVVQMLHEEPDDEDEEAICPDSESEISDDDDDSDYFPHGQTGAVGMSGNPALLHEDSSHDREDSSDESSEEESQTQSNRLSKMGLTGMRIPLLMAEQEAIIFCILLFYFEGYNNICPLFFSF